MAIRLDMTMSVDGYVVGPDDSVDAPMGDGGFRLFNWLDRRNDPGPSGQVVAESMATRAVIAGRRTFEHAGQWNGDHHDGVPIFILYRRQPAIDIGQWPLVTPVSDVASAMTQAKEAAGAKDVLVHGAGVARLALTAGVLDELELHVVPVLFGQGRRLFDGLAAEQIELERTRILEGENGITHLRYRVWR
jgi:dihydrofolate reductase